jgi:hypothetical protein
MTLRTFKALLIALPTPFLVAYFFHNFCYVLIRGSGGYNNFLLIVLLLIGGVSLLPKFLLKVFSWFLAVNFDEEIQIRKLHFSFGEKIPAETSIIFISNFISAIVAVLSLMFATSSAKNDELADNGLTHTAIIASKEVAHRKKSKNDSLYYLYAHTWLKGEKIEFKIETTKEDYLSKPQKSKLKIVFLAEDPRVFKVLPNK